MRVVAPAVVLLFRQWSEIVRKEPRRMRRSWGSAETIAILAIEAAADGYVGNVPRHDRQLYNCVAVPFGTFLAATLLVAAMGIGRSSVRPAREDCRWKASGKEYFTS